MPRTIRTLPTEKAKETFWERQSRPEQIKHCKEISIACSVKTSGPLLVSSAKLPHNWLCENAGGAPSVLDKLKAKNSKWEIYFAASIKTKLLSNFQQQVTEGTRDGHTTHPWENIDMNWDFY